MGLRISLFFIFITCIASVALSAPVDSCQKSCSIHADCGKGALCQSGVCQFKPRFCVNDRWSANERGEYQNCSAYSCDDKSGLCRTQAVDSGDCSVGYVHDGSSSCIKSINCDLQDPTCQDLSNKWQQTRKNWEALNPEPKIQPYSCMACTTHQDCSSNMMCWDQRCVPSGSFCQKGSDGQESSKQKDGLTQSCAEYTCDVVSGQCRNFCIEDSQCRQGTVCSKDRRCVSPNL